MSCISSQPFGSMVLKEYLNGNAELVISNDILNDFGYSGILPGPMGDVLGTLARRREFFSSPYLQFF
jgi:hypothetical protein